LFSTPFFFGGGHAIIFHAARLLVVCGRLPLAGADTLAAAYFVP